MRDDRRETGIRRRRRWIEGEDGDLGDGVAGTAEDGALMDR